MQVGEHQKTRVGIEKPQKSIGNTVKAERFFDPFEQRKTPPKTNSANVPILHRNRGKLNRKSQVSDKKTAHPEEQAVEKSDYSSCSTKI